MIAVAVVVCCPQLRLSLVLSECGGALNDVAVAMELGLEVAVVIGMNERCQGWALDFLQKFQITSEGAAGAPWMGLGPQEPHRLRADAARGAEG